MVERWVFDGTLYASEQAARIAEAEQRMTDQIDQAGVGRGGEWDASMILEWLKEDLVFGAALADFHALITSTKKTAS